MSILCKSHFTFIYSSADRNHKGKLTVIMKSNQLKNKLLHMWIIVFRLTFFNFIIIIFFFTLQYCVGFAIHQHESTTGVHVFPILNSPSHIPPRSIPLGHPRAPAPSILYPALNLDRWFISYMILYMFQCHSPKSSLLLPLPQSQKVCCVHLRLFCCLAYRVIVTIFLNSIYMC